VSGAQLAARMQIFFDQNRCSPDIKKREVALSARSSLSFWNLGLRTLPRSLPIKRQTEHPDGQVANLTAETYSGEDVVVSEISVSDIQVLNNVEFPVPLSVACQDMDVIQQAAQAAGILPLYSTEICQKPTERGMLRPLTQQQQCPRTNPLRARLRLKLTIHQLLWKS